MQKLKAGIVSQVSLADLKPDPNQPRKTFDDKSLKALADSLKVKVEIPLKVRQSGAQLFIIDGERRFRAAKIAKLKALPCLLDEEAEPINLAGTQLTTGVQREALGALDIAEFLVDLKDREKKTPNELAAALSKRGLTEIGRSKIDSYLRLVELPDWAKSMMRAGQLNETHGAVILQTVQYPQWSSALRSEIKRSMDWKGSVTVRDIKDALNQTIGKAGVDLNNKWGPEELRRIFPIEPCRKCQFYKAIGKMEYCMDIKQFKAKQNDAIRLAAEKEAKRKIKNDAREVDASDPLAVQPAKLKESGVGVVILKHLPYGRYAELAGAQFDKAQCMTCKHRKLASTDGSQTDAGDVCFLIPCFQRKSKEGRRQNNRLDHFRALLEQWLRATLVRLLPIRLTAPQKQALLVWTAAGAVEKYSPSWTGMRHENSAKAMQPFLGENALLTLDDIMAFAKEPLTGEQLSRLAVLSIDAMTRDQVRMMAQLIDVRLDAPDPAPAFRAGTEYFKLKRKAELQELCKLAGVENVIDKGMKDLRELLDKPELIERIGVPLDIEKLYREPFEAVDDPFDIGPDDLDDEFDEGSLDEVASLEGEAE